MRDFKDYDRVIWIEADPKLSRVRVIDDRKNRDTFWNLEAVAASDEVSVVHACDDGSFAITFNRPTKCVLYRNAALYCGEKAIEYGPGISEKEEERLKPAF